MGVKGTGSLDTLRLRDCWDVVKLSFLVAGVKQVSWSLFIEDDKLLRLNFFPNTLLIPRFSMSIFDVLEEPLSLMGFILPLLPPRL